MCNVKVDRGVALFFALGIYLSPASGFAQSASTVFVDASTPVTESDGDDLKTLQNIFQDANAPADGALGGLTDPRRKIISDLNMKRSRLLQADTYCDLDVNGNFGQSPFPDANGNYGPVVPGDCDLMKWEIDGATLGGLSPHVAVAYYMPQSFVAYGPQETWPEAIKSRYQSYAQQLVQYVAKRAFDGGAPSVVFEVSNELDIADDAPLGYSAWLAWLNQCAAPCSPSNDPVVLGFPMLGPWGRALWWMDPATYKLDVSNIWGPDGYPFINDVRRVTRAITPMQKIFGDAIQAVQAQYPGKIQFAGPAFAGTSFGFINYYGQELPTLEEHFLEDMAGLNTSLDYFSFHYYGDFRNGVTAVSPSDPKWNLSRQTGTLKYETDRIRAKLVALGHPETKLFVSEWGPSVDQSSDINYSHKGAAWAAAFLTEAVADKIAMGSYLIIDDAVGAQQPGSPGQASLTHKDGNGNYLPKPAANVFKMFAMMTGARRAVTIPAANANLGAFAASDANSAGVVVFNYDYSYGFADTPQNFSVELDNLPLDGLVTVQRYLVDANTSNLAAYLNNQPGATDPDLQIVETLSLPVTNGQLKLPERTLGLGVTFWRITG